MTTTEVTAYREQLKNMIDRLQFERSHLRQTVLHMAEEDDVPEQEPFHSLDDNRHETADGEVALSVLGTEEDLLTECSAALKRIEAGTFGQCECCRRPISQKRLHTMPYVRQCIHCARQPDSCTQS
ncbi:MAG TPA: TraR/DksA C4-type zinc finger protein [Gemmataceae bacterium]|jgi:DnaK suppressor protein|nr:TraR/DksA C4-type zinc finger protein [Gemmataceae bacterium]